MESKIILLCLMFVGCNAAGTFSLSDYEKNARRAAARDAFPVLTMPELASVAEGDYEITDDEPVIGIVINGEARAYPISVMGSHELVNDECGGEPIAVSW